MQVLKHKAVSTKLAFIFYLKINAHLSFIQMKTEKGYRNQVGTLTEQTSQTSSSSLTFPINKKHEIESFFFLVNVVCSIKRNT